MDAPESRKSPTITRLFWVVVIGGCAAFVWGKPALYATILAMIAIVWRRLDRPRRFRALVRKTARGHAETLALRRRQERFIDAYGNAIEDGWLRERDYFVERTIVPLADARGFATEIDRHWDWAIDAVERTARAVRLPEEPDLPTEGLAYERFCAEKLGLAGWRAHTTPAQGDQGADVVAERGGTRLVLQCKLWRKPVGNAAVQEVAAAARHWSGDMAAVVTNAGFTPSARKLAASTGVLLLHHDQLDGLEPLQNRRVPTGLA